MEPLTGLIDDAIAVQHNCLLGVHDWAEIGFVSPEGHLRLPGGEICVNCHERNPTRRTWSIAVARRIDEGSRCCMEHPDRPSKEDVDRLIPRRIRLDKMSPAEKAIYDAVQAVEAMPADVRLTDAVVLLQKAREKVADFVDDID